MKAKTKRKKYYRAIFFMYIKCACLPNQNGNGRAELKNCIHVYGGVADSNGNEFHEWSRKVRE